MTIPLDSPPPLPLAASSRSNSAGEITEIVSGASASKSPLPPGFRFHPTDVELVLYHLERKICCRRVKLNIIREVDVYKCEPWELPGKSLLQTGDKQWYFFSPRDRKYPNGSRSNRGTKCGYWKATGKDRSISHNSRTVGMKKTLVFYNGRAPKGQRTNWVMHEYSMAKEELQRCNAVQDSFALYKVYQKSGAGPKNGEEYGAPFREEEWLDDDDPVNESLGIPCNDQSTELDPFASYDQFHIGDDLGRVLQQILDEPEANQQYLKTSLNELEVGGEDSTFVVGPSREAISCGPAEPQPCEPVDPGQTGLLVACSTASVVQPCEVTEVPYDLDWVNLDSSGIDGDFMELNDLNDQEPSGLSLQNINSSMVPHDMDGSCYQEPAASCLLDINNDMLSRASNKLHDQEPSTFSSQDVNNDLFSYNVNGLSDPNIYFDAPICFPEEIGPLDFSSTVVASQLDHQFLNHSTDENPFHQPYISSQLWAHEEKLNAFSTPSEPSQVLVTSPNSGSTNISGGTQVKGSIMGNSSNRWFTSAVYSLLESIPTNPASATENALINRAFERMSSFGAGRSGSSDMNDNVDGDGAAGPGRRQGRNGGILFISFLGALCAILWVLMIGTTVKVFKSFAGKFIAS